MSEKNKLIITIVASVLVAIGIAVGIYFPMNEIGIRPFDGNPKNLRKEIEGLKKELDGFQAKIKQIPDAEEKKRLLEPVSQEAAQLLPRERNPIDLIGAIRQKATEAGVITTVINPGKVAAVSAAKQGFGPGSRSKAAPVGAAFDEWTFSLELEGTCDQIGLFVNKMEEFEVPGATDGRMEKRFFVVRNISITASRNGLTEGVILVEGKPMTATHKCSLSMVTYRDSSAPEPVKPAAAPAKGK